MGPSLNAARAPSSLCSDTERLPIIWCALQRRREPACHADQRDGEGQQRPVTPPWAGNPRTPEQGRGQWGQSQNGPESNGYEAYQNLYDGQLPREQQQQMQQAQRRQKRVPAWRREDGDGRQRGDPWTERRQQPWDTVNPNLDEPRRRVPEKQSDNGRRWSQGRQQSDNGTWTRGANGSGGGGGGGGGGGSPRPRSNIGPPKMLKAGNQREGMPKRYREDPMPQPPPDSGKPDWVAWMQRSWRKATGWDAYGPDGKLTLPDMGPIPEFDEFGRPRGQKCAPLLAVCMLDDLAASPQHSPTREQEREPDRIGCSARK